MSSIEDFSASIASKISKVISNSKYEEEVIAYGLFALLQTIISIFAIAVFGLIFDVLTEALVISFAASILRKFSGGAHASSPVNCAVIGMIIFGGLALAIKYLLNNLSFGYLLTIIVIAFILTFYVMHKYSPVGTSSKPLKNENTRRRLKRKSMAFVLILLSSDILLISYYLHTNRIVLLNIAFYISAGIAWQSITLVSLGQTIINRLDNVLRGTNIIIRRINK